ncbi:MAG: M20/M25/M40 family metallo-hydrolase [Gemmatimonadota bacterium]
MKAMLFLPAMLAFVTPRFLPAQSADSRITAIVRAVSSARIEHDLTALVGFGTRHTLSDTISSTRGIGAARRWVKAQFDSISAECGGCLEVRFEERTWPADRSRLPRDVRIVNVLATLRGTEQPDRYLLMTAHLDSRASDANDTLSDAPGAADDGSGVAAVLEAARVLAQAGPYRKSIVLAALSGEEQGLYGGRQLAEMARDSGWIVEGVLNNDIIGNRAGLNGEKNEREFRVFSEPVPFTESESQRNARRSRGGEVDGPSRQLARYVDRVTEQFVRDADAVMIYRLDRFGRGGDHRAFNDLGFPAVRFTVMNENYNRQHQNVRTEDGISYGDVLEEVSYSYIARVTAANAATLASLAWAPPPPDSVTVGGAVTPNTTLRWIPPASGALAGFRLYWRETTEARWRHHRDVGDLREFTLENINIDNYFFGVAALGKDGTESVVVFAH